MLKRLTVVALAALPSCARQEPPPGGPPDTAPPQIVAVKPESGAVVPDFHDDLVIRFDEVIEEMTSGPSGEGFGRQVLLSPVAGEVKVSWARSALHVRPREGWKRGRVYHLEIRPGIADLRRNVLKDGRVVVFSTGPAIPTAELTGTIVQWVEQRAAQEGMILAAHLPDTVPYRALADSAGQVRLTNLPPGRYLVYGVVDQNRNGVRDRREAYDSTAVTIDSTTSVVLWAFQHDTVGPRVRTAEFVDSITARLTFTSALDPTLAIDTSRVRVLALPDSAPVALAAVLAPAQYDSLTARERAAAAAADSTRRAAADTTRPPADTTRPAPAAGRPGGPTRIAAGPPPTAAGDTTAFRALLRRRPVPVDRVIVRFAAPLRPGARYVARVRGARNLNGAVADGQAMLVVPEPPKPKPAPKDSVKP